MFSRGPPPKFQGPKKTQSPFFCFPCFLRYFCFFCCLGNASFDDIEQTSAMSTDTANPFEIVASHSNHFSPTGDDDKKQTAFTNAEQRKENSDFDSLPPTSSFSTSTQKTSDPFSDLLSSPSSASASATTISE